MSFVLKSVELSNIRNHEYVLFEPDIDGVTSIQGKNGSGKTTLVNAIAWCLYGTKMGGSTNKSVIRDGVEYEPDKIYAKVGFIVSGQEYYVHKRVVSKAGTVESNLYVLQDDGEWKHLVGPAVSQTHKEIKKIIGMDEKGFLSSVLVQQKQVDKLILSTPAERAGVIEDLTGITSITNAIKAARKEYKSLKDASTYSSADAEGIAEHEDAIVELGRKIALVEQEIVFDAEKLEELKQEGIRYKEAYDIHKARREEKTQYENELNVAEGRLSDKLTERDELVADRDERKKSLGSMNSLENAKKVIADKNEAQAERDRVFQALSRAQNALQANQETIKEQQDLLDSVTSQYGDQLETALQEQEDTLTASQTCLREYKDNVVSLRTSNKSLKTAIEALSHDDGECPTCLQKVDEPDNVIQGLQSQIDENDKIIEQSNNDALALDEEIKKTTEVIQSLEKAIQGKKKLEEAQAQQDLLQKTVDEQTGNYNTITKRLESLEKKAEKASNIVYQLEEYQRVLKKAQSSSKQVNTLQIEINNLKEKIGKIDTISKSKFEKLEGLLEKKRSDYQTLNQELTEKRGREAVLREKLNSVENSVIKLREDYEKHQKLMEGLAVAASTVKILEEFKKARVDSSVPLITNYASNFISDFTNGKFIRLTLDSKFNTHVTLSNGVERSVNELSGGELSAAAIALRLAISMLLSGGVEKTALILDEVLISMDEDRAHNIMNTVKEVSRGQVIFIAHSDSINTIADKVFELRLNRNVDDATEESEEAD